MTRQQTLGSMSPSISASFSVTKARKAACKALRQLGALSLVLGGESLLVQNGTNIVIKCDSKNRKQFHSLSQ